MGSGRVLEYQILHYFNKFYKFVTVERKQPFFVLKTGESHNLVNNQFRFELSL